MQSDLDEHALQDAIKVLSEAAEAHFRQMQVVALMLNPSVFQQMMN